jgi:hypothetical protein
MREKFKREKINQMDTIWQINILGHDQKFPCSPESAEYQAGRGFQGFMIC